MNHKQLTDSNLAESQESNIKALNLIPNEASASNNRLIPQDEEETLVLAQYYENKGNMTQAFTKYCKLAGQHNMVAQNKVREIFYRDYKNIFPDPVQAFMKHQERANKGEVIDNLITGWMYQYGWGTEKNEKKALGIFLEIAFLKYAVAQYELGEAYANARGVAKDEAKAVEWYTEAAKQGHPDAQLKLNFMKNYAKAVELSIKAAEQGHPDAQYNLGVMYTYGIGVAKDEAKAAEWYTKAAKQGHVAAQLWISLGESYCIE